MNPRPAAKIPLLAVIGLAAAFLPAPLLGAQAAKGGAVPRLPAALLGIRPGMDLDDAHALLQKQGGTPASSPKAGIAPSPDADTHPALPPDKNALRSKPAPADQDDNQGHQEAWKLRRSPYASVALASDDKGHVLWVTGFARPGQEMPFAQLGDTKAAAATGPTFTIWNVIAPYKSYRVVARGRGGKASVVSLLTLTMANPNGIFSPQVIPPSSHSSEPAP